MLVGKLRSEWGLSGRDALDFQRRFMLGGRCDGGGGVMLDGWEDLGLWADELQGLCSREVKACDQAAVAHRVYSKWTRGGG